MVKAAKVTNSREIGEVVSGIVSLQGFDRQVDTLSKPQV
jgi:hypothetical protein